MQKSSFLLYFGYLFLLLSMIGLDQTTKLHAEKTYLESFDSSDIRTYRSTQERIKTWGVSPSLATENNLESKDVTENWLDFHFTYVRNPGAAWGSFANLPEPYRLWAFYLVTLLASALVVYLFRSSHGGLRVTRTALVFIFAGAMGNFLDRVQLTYVIDFIQFHWKIFGWEYSFPVFNVADISINIGMGLMLIDMLVNETALKKKNLAIPQDSRVAVPPS